MQDVSNSLSLPPERVEWRRRMDAVREAVLASNSQIPNDIENQISHYEDDVKVLQTIIEHMRYKISPLGRHPLTNEILARIFKEVYLHNPNPKTALTISHVCGHWRKVAFQCPRLWTGLELMRNEVNLTQLSEWAKRARELPLRITIRCSRHTNQEALVTWLQKRSDRITGLAIQHLMRRRQSYLINSLPPLPRMNALEIHGFDPVDLDTRVLMRVLAQSRAIVNLTLSSVYGLQDLPSLDGFADRLLRLTLGGVTQLSHQYPILLGFALRLIAPCISLQHLECHAVLFQTPDIGAVFLEHLVSLAIGDAQHTCVVLRYLHVPNLKVLHLVRRTCLDRFKRPVRHHNTAVPQEYTLLLASCLQDLYNNCAPKIKTIIWDHARVGVIDILRQFMGTNILYHLEVLECRGLGRLDVDSFRFFLEPQAANPVRSLRTIIFTRCTMGPYGLRQAREPMRLVRKIRLGDIVKREDDTQG